MTLKATRPNRRKVRPIPKGPTKGQRTDVRREEFNRLVDLLNERAEVINRLLQEQRIQFQRIAQLQAELDRLKQAWARLKLAG